MQEPDTRPAIAAAVIVHHSQFLLVRRAVSEGSLSWQFPAGEVEEGETPEDAAVRETAEEAGLAVVVTERLGERVHPNTGRTMIYIACEVTEGEAHAADAEEIAAVHWCRLDEIAQYVPYGFFDPVQKYLEEELPPTAEELTKQDVREVLDIYVRAWEGQDPNLIVAIFTEDATYHERVLQAPIPNREAIRRYWETKVVESQGNIKCDVLNVYLDGDTAIAEWEAEFDDLVQRVRKRMREIAVLEFRAGKIAALREYWSSETVAELVSGD